MTNSLPTSMPNFRQIKSFLALARHLSFTRAAEELGISQPTLTVQIHQLEEILSVSLFDRNRRQVRLTEVGRNLLQPLEQLLLDLDSVMNFSNDHAQLKSGTIRIAALPSIASTLLPRAIRLFNDNHPGIAVHAHDVEVERMAEMIRLEQVDFAIGIKMLPDKDIVADDFLSDQLCVFFPENHPLHARKKQKPDFADCLAYPVILTARKDSVRKVIERALTEDGLEITVVHEVNHIPTALGMVRNGLGISILPYSAVLNGSMDGLAFAPIASPGLHREIGILRKSARRLSPAADQFLQVLHQVARDNELFQKSANMPVWLTRRAGR